MKRRMIFLVLVTTILAAGLVLAGDFKIQYGGDEIFTVATNATVLAQNVSLSGWINTVGNISTDGYFIGDGSYISGITVDDNSTQILWQNITNFPTCAANQHLDFDGTDLTCTDDSVPDDSINLAGENITSGTVGETYLPSTIYTISTNATLLTVGEMPVGRLPTFDYHNITDIPTCSAGQHLFYDGTDLSCPADAGGNLTNVAYINNTHTWTDGQTFDEDINLSTSSIRFMDNASSITRDGVESTNITIDSLGNIIINLG